MSFTEINSMMKEAIENVKGMLDGDSVVGKPVASESVTIVPISKISVGFVTGGYDMKSKSVKINAPDDSEPIAAIGGGVTVTPIGFLVVSEDGSATFIKTQGDGTDKWLDIIQSTIKNAIKKQ
jgi:Uncharacterized conserved protein